MEEEVGGLWVMSPIILVMTGSLWRQSRDSGALNQEALLTLFGSDEEESFSSSYPSFGLGVASVFLVATHTLFLV